MPNFSTFPLLGGYIGSCSILLQLFQPWGGGTSVVALSCFNSNSSTFSILGCGRGTLDIHSILLQLFQSWGEYIGSCSILLQLFQSWGGTSVVALSCFNFFNSGMRGVHQKFTLLHLFHSWWGTSDIHSILLQLFQSCGGTLDVCSILL